MAGTFDSLPQEKMPEGTLRVGLLHHKYNSYGWYHVTCAFDRSELDGFEEDALLMIANNLQTGGIDDSLQEESSAPCTPSKKKRKVEVKVKAEMDG